MIIRYANDGHAHLTYTHAHTDIFTDKTSFIYISAKRNYKQNATNKRLYTYTFCSKKKKIKILYKVLS